MRGSFVLLLLFSMGISALAQNDETERNIETALENRETNIDISMLYDDVGFFKKFNLNNASATKLSQLPFLSPLDVSKIKNHIIQYGKLISYEELQVSGLAIPKIKTLKKFTFIHKPDRFLNKHSTEYYYLVQTNTPIKNGFETDTFKGDPFKHAFRLKYKKQHWGYALALEKDAGEKWFGRKYSPYDHNTGYVYFKPTSKILKQVVLGDFVMSYGQGLTLGQGFNLGKSALIVYSKNMFSGIKPHHSFNEIRFFRGGASSFQLNKIKVDVFASFKNVDANLVSDSVNQENATLSLNGFHRTNRELQRRNTLLLKSGGTHLSYYTPIGEIGFTAFGGKWNKVFSFGSQEYKKLLKPHTQFMFTGFDFDWMIKNWNIYGETTYDFNQNQMAFIGGALTSLSKKVDFSLVARHYPSGFSNQFGSAFGENSINRNENGVYTGLVWKHKRKFAIKSYYDYFVKPAADYFAVSKHEGSGLLVQAEYFPKRRDIIYFRFRIRTKERDINQKMPEKQRVKSIFTQYRLHYDFKVSDEFRAKSRVEFNAMNKEGDIKNGFLVYQDINFKPTRSSWNFKSRIAYFNTNNYQTGIYAFEPELLYNYRVFAYYGKGSKFILTVKKKFKNGLSLSLRPAWIIYNDTISRGSGKDKRAGKIFSDYKIVLYGRF